jgi:hypothetical protein
MALIKNWPAPEIMSLKMMGVGERLQSTVTLSSTSDKPGKTVRVNM